MQEIHAMSARKELIPVQQVEFENTNVTRFRFRKGSVQIKILHFWFLFQA